MDIASKQPDEIRLVERNLYPKDGRVVEVKSGVNERTGEFVVETNETQEPWSIDMPGFSWKSSDARLRDDNLWREKLAIHRETLAAQEPEVLPDVDFETKDYHENLRRAERGMKTFGGLGGLLGPDGALGKK